MNGILLTQYQGSILGPIAKYLLGPIINGIFKVLDFIFGSFDSGLVGLSIIFFTIVVYLLLTPLTIKQQKFSKLSAKMNPEIQAIQAKYKGKKDNDSMMAMNAETKAVYAKYGTSPSGSCVQLLIQMPILFALYRVIYSLPAYIPTLKEKFEVIANQVISGNLVEELKGLSTSAQYVKNFDIEGNQVNAVIDCLNSMNIDTLAEYAKGSQDCLNAVDKIRTYNVFLGMNLTNSPLDMIKDAWTNAGGIKWGLLIAAIMVPVLAAATQWFNTKLMPQPNANNSGNQSDTAASMQQSMSVMNKIMPLMSAFFCLSFSSGIGVYWIAGAVVRSVQQVVINKHIDKIDIEEQIKINQEKYKKKLEKKGIDPNKVNSYATMSTKNIGNNSTQRRSMADKASLNNQVSKKDKDVAMKEATEYYNNNNKQYAPGSLAAKANMVSQYNNRNENK